MGPLSVLSQFQALPLEMLRHLEAWGHIGGLVISQPPADMGLNVDMVVSQAPKALASVLLHPKVIPSTSGNCPAVPPCKHNLSLQASHIGPVIKQKVESGQCL